MQLDAWTQSLVSALSSLWSRIINFIPELFGALILILLGLIIARLVDTLLSKLLAKLGFDRLMRAAGVPKMLMKVGIQIPVSTLIGKIIFWFILLIFMTSALQTMGLDRVSTMLDAVAVYLPKVFGAAIILLVGVFLAQLLNGLAKVAAEGVGLNYASTIGRLVQGLVVIISLSVAISQMDVNILVLNIVIAIVLSSLGLAAALALGLGSRDIVRQIIAGIYIRELYSAGDLICIEDTEAEIEEIGTVKTTLITTEKQRITIANTVLLDQRVIDR